MCLVNCFLSFHDTVESLGFDKVPFYSPLRKGGHPTGHLPAQISSASYAAACTVTAYTLNVTLHFFTVPLLMEPETMDNISYLLWLHP